MAATAGALERRAGSAASQRNSGCCRLFRRKPQSGADPRGSDQRSGQARTPDRRAHRRCLDRPGWRRAIKARRRRQSAAHRAIDGLCLRSELGHFLCAVPHSRCAILARRPEGGIADGDGLAFWGFSASPDTPVRVIAIGEPGLAKGPERGKGAAPERAAFPFAACCGLQNSRRDAELEAGAQFRNCLPRSVRFRFRETRNLSRPKMLRTSRLSCIGKPQASRSERTTKSTIRPGILKHVGRRKATGREHARWRN